MDYNNEFSDAQLLEAQILRLIEQMTNIKNTEPVVLYKIKFFTIEWVLLEMEVEDLSKFNVKQLVIDLVNTYDGLMKTKDPNRVLNNQIFINAHFIYK